MSKLVLTLGAAILVLSASDGAAAAQAPGEAKSAKVWVGRTAEYEDFVRTAEIVRVESHPRRHHQAPSLLLCPRRLSSRAWPTRGSRRGGTTGHWESYKSEMAAYELDKLLELQMIPPTVEKRVKGDLGAAVMWVGPVQSFKQMGGPPTPPAAHADSWNRQLSKAKMFDNLINNQDPNLGELARGSRVEPDPDRPHPRLRSRKGHGPPDEPDREGPLGSAC